MSLQAGSTAAVSDADQFGESLDAVHEFYRREELGLGGPQRVVEGVSRFVGQPLFLALILAFVTSWLAANAVLRALRLAPFDPPPYFWLQGIVGLGALLTATAVLIQQNRLARLARQREHLDLKLTLLTEQKAAKLIDLIEELRRDLPNVRDRADSAAVALQQAMSPSGVLAALGERPGSPAAAVSEPAPPAASPSAPDGGPAPP